jgi:hypothetical protein
MNLKKMYVLMDYDVVLPLGVYSSEKQANFALEAKGDGYDLQIINYTLNSIYIPKKEVEETKLPFDTSAVEKRIAEREHLLEPIRTNERK